MSLKNSLYKVIAKTGFDKEINLPTSKSHANRALIIGAIRGRDFKIEQLSDSSDVTAMIACLQKIGLRVTHTGSTIIFHNSFPECEGQTKEDQIDLFTGDGGTTNRFLIALLSRGKKTYRLFPAEKMAERPIDDLLEPLKKLHVKIQQSEQGNDGLWLTLQGPASMMTTSKIEIDCSKSTQFATAMKLAFSNLPLQVEAKNVDASADYLKLTDEVIKQTLQKNNYFVPVDFSSLSYPAALAALNGRCVIKNCHSIDPYQADAKLLQTLKEIGVNCEMKEQGLTITGAPSLGPVHVSIKHYPDLFPTFVFLAAHIEGASTFTHLEVLRHKESDRLAEMLKILKAFQVDFQYDQNAGELTIKGSSKRNRPAVRITPPRDHRIVMAAYLFMRYNNGGELLESDCVEKSFPHFFSELE